MLVMAMTSNSFEKSCSSYSCVPRVRILDGEWYGKEKLRDTLTLK